MIRANQKKSNKNQENRKTSGKVKKQDVDQNSSGGLRLSQSNKEKIVLNQTVLE